MNEKKSEYALRLHNVCKAAIMQLAKYAEDTGTTSLFEKDINEIDEIIKDHEKRGFDCTEEKIAFDKICDIFNKQKKVL